MDNSPIDKLYAESKAVLDFFANNNETSFKSDMDNILKRYLLLASGGHFEECIKNILINFVTRGTNSNKLIIEFLRNAGMERRYHTYFNWDSTNANQFFALFGDEFKNKMIQKVNADATLKTSMADFIQIGSVRNSLAHTNVNSIGLDKTTEDTYAQYQSAQKFVIFLEKQLLESV